MFRSASSSTTSNQKSRCRKRRLLVSLIIGLLGGVAIGFFCQSYVMREFAIRSLLSDSPTSRQRGTRWLLTPVVGGSEGELRIHTQSNVLERITKRLYTDGVSEAVFYDVVYVIQESGGWSVDLVDQEVWVRRIALSLDKDSEYEGAVYQAIDWLLELPPPKIDPVDKEGAREIQRSWSILLDWEVDPKVREQALLRGCGWYGVALAEHAIVVNCLDDSDDRIRRFAWLMLGHINPIHGYTADWDHEQETLDGEYDLDAMGIAEAMLWAATVTNPDQANAVINAMGEETWPTNALMHIARYSTDPRVKKIATSYGSRPHREYAIAPAAELGILETDLWEDYPKELAAWLGKGDTLDTSMSPASHRWWLWRRFGGSTSDLSDRPEVPDLSSSVVAADGSVWASVLLAERCLDKATATDISLEWMRSLDLDINRAGILLAGLLNANTDQIDTILENQNLDPIILQSARLAHMMVANPAHHNSVEFAFAWRLMSDDVAGTDIDILVALLASGDEAAFEFLLGKRSDALNAVDHLLSMAWLTERFCPEQYAIAAPLSPWDERSAQLQLDIMWTHYNLHRR